MTTDKILNDSFTWGDLVRVKQSAPINYNSGELGSVSGLRTIESSDVAQKFNQVIGSCLYLVEFSNGESLEVPEIFLTKIG
jgi:hypothetical protein